MRPSLESRLKMKNTLTKFSILLLLILLSATNLANAQQIITPAFSIDLPIDMKETFNKQDTQKNIYQAVFQTPPFGDYSPLQIRITAIGKAPTQSVEYPAWETKVLGAYIGMLAVSYQLDLSTQTAVLNKKPEKLKLGNQTFTTATMTFGSMQTYFLVTTKKQTTYNIILISIDKNSQMRSLKMDRLLESIKGMQYFGVMEQA